MSDPHLFDRNKPGLSGAARSSPFSSNQIPDEEAAKLAMALDALEAESSTLPAATIDRKRVTTRLKLAEGARGIKQAIRAESSFFAHAYRGLLIAISAIILGVPAIGWCFLLISAALVLLAETFRCTIHVILDELDDPDEPRFVAAREIASGGLLFASITSAGLTLMVLTSRLGELLGW